MAKPLSIIQMIHLYGPHGLRTKGDCLGCIAVEAFMRQHRSMRFHLDLIQLSFGEVGDWETVAHTGEVDACVEEMGATSG